MKTAAILFDLDGTLLDTAPEFTTCVNYLLTQAGKQPISVEKVRSAVSFGAQGMIECAFNISPSDPNFLTLKQQFLEAYAQTLGLETSFFPGILPLLTFLTEQQLPWGIVTNKPMAYTQGLIQHFAPLQQAACVIAGDTLSTQKPHPAPLLHACALLKVQPENCWYIGDAKSDVQASKAAGMRCAVANYGYIPAGEDVQTWEADYYLAQAHDIKQAILL